MLKRTILWGLMKAYQAKLVSSDLHFLFFATFIDISDYAMCTYGQVADRYQLEKISQIPFYGDLAKTTAGIYVTEGRLLS